MNGERQIMRTRRSQLMEISVTIRTDLVQPVPANILYNTKQRERSVSYIITQASQCHPVG